MGLNLVFIVLFFISSFSSIGIEEIRSEFLTVETTKEADAYIYSLENSDFKEADAYIAVMLLMKAKFAIVPFTKWNYFKKGSSLLDKTIASNTSNVEMRYLRFLFQSETPKFLGYHINIQTDYNFITKNVITCSLPLEFKHTMLNKILLVKGLTKLQTVEINKIIKKL